MRERTIKLISVLLATVILYASSYAVISYAADTYKSVTELENQGTSTNNDNVEVDVYYAGKKHTKTMEVTSLEEKVYVRVAVKNAGYLENAQIDLSDCNFEIADDESNAGKIKTIDAENKKVVLNRVVAGSEVEIALNITPTKAEKIATDTFNKDNKIKMNGTYVNAKAKEVEASKELTIHTSWHGEAKAKISQEIVKYIPYEIGEEEELLLQTEVTTEVENSVLPVKSSEVTVEIPELAGTKPTKVMVYAKTTESTNGEKTAISFNESNYSYDETKGEVVIKVANNANSEGKISWVKNAQDKYEIVMVYPKEVIAALKESTSIIQTSASITNEYYDDVDYSSNAGTTAQTPLSQKGTIADYEGGIENESIAKGYMYNGVETTYTEKYSMSTSDAEVTDEMSIAVDIPEFIKESGETVNGANNIYNKKVSVDIAELKKILGETGKVEIILNSKVVGTIDANTEVDSNGKATVDISAEKASSIEVKTSKPQTQGQLSVEIEKAIASDISYSLAERKIFTGVKQVATGTAKAGEEQITTAEVTDTMNLVEPTAKGTININKDTLSTVVSNDVEITALLETDSADDSLYENPTISIKLPEKVANINIDSIQLLHTDEIKMQNYEVVETDGVKTIKIYTKGIQTKYNDSVTKGINIVIYATINLDRTTASKEAEISMNVDNNTYTRKINLVAPSGLVTINTIKGFSKANQTVEVIDNESTTGKLDVYSESKTAQVENTIINNYNNDIYGTSILGRIPTKESMEYDSSEKMNNTIDTKLNGAIAVSGLESGYKVYYSENASATKDLTNSDNGWKENVTDYSSVKSYLIVLENEMAQASQIVYNYSLNIPENLPYNRTINSYYKVYYGNAVTETATSTKTSPKIELTTGAGPELTASLAVKNTTDNKVNVGNIFNYSIEVKNEGTVDVNDAKVSVPIPEGMSSVTSTESFKYNEETKSMETTLDSMKVGETQLVEGAIVAEKEGNYELKATITSTEIPNNIESNKYTVTAEKADFAIRNTNASGIRIVKGMEACFLLEVENLTDKEAKNVKIEYTLPQGVTYKKNVIAEGLEDTKFESKGNTVTITIPTLEANSTATMFIYGDVENVSNDMKSVAKATINGKQYTSNEANLDAGKTEYSLTGVNPGEKYVKEGQELVSEFTIKNTGDNTIYSINTEYNIPDGTTFVSGTIESGDKTQKLSVNEEGKIQKAISMLEADETAKVTITLKANKLDSKKDKEVVSTLKISSTSAGEIESNKLEYVIEYDKTQHEDDGKNNTKNNEIVDPGEIDNDDGYKITGKAWLDSNLNGKFDENEKTLQGIKVILVNKDTGEIVKDKDNKKEKITTTGEDGKYEIDNLENGNYIVAFLYDDKVYSITEYQKADVEKSLNSDAISSNIKYEGVTQKAGLTDTLTVKDGNIRDIDIGLYLTPTFDLSLNKYINKVTVNSGSKMTTYEYDNQNKTLAKIDIPAKQMATSTVILEYKIVVTNEGTVPGYAKKIVDYLPEDLKFSTELNSGAYLGKDGNIYSEELADTLINPGESKEITIILTKKMTDTNTGTIINEAEIAESYNELGLDDVNSEAGNRDEKENDLGAAKTIISVKTGEVVIYTTLIVAVITILAAGVYLIKKYVVKK